MSSDPNPDHDPMKTVAGALQQVSRPSGSGTASVGRSAVEQYGFLGQMAYRASYGISFGFVYPVAKLARLMPRDNALMYGLHDGAVAARDEASNLWRSSEGSVVDPLEVPNAPHPA